ncbi:MAG TPA: DUF302 domain-containing protein [Sulfurovum sp. UBA12169]|nr:MAG TPA: DUF302 domain-containing protein [Sulfurovum sp. UBA12169]
MKRITKGLILSLLVATGLAAEESKAPVAAVAHDVRVFTADNSDGKITPATIEEAFTKAGFVIAANNDMNVPFMRDFNTTSFDVYNLFVVYRKDTVLALAEKYPKIGLFSPMSMSIYTKKGTKTISVSSLSAAGMAKMMDIPGDNEAINALGKKVEEALKAAMPNGQFDILPYQMKEPAGPLVTNVTFDVEDDDWETVKEDLEMEFEGVLAPNGFVMAGFTDLGYDLEESDKEWYHFYDVYSVCSIPVIYAVAIKHPEAGAFAPCSIYLYQKAGEQKINMAFPSVHKWISSLNIEDKESLDVLMDAQKKLENIFSTFAEKQ